MKQNVPTLKASRQRKFLLVLPLLVLPFLTLMFRSLGGGTEGRAGSPLVMKKGLDMQLPDAYLKDRPALTKMSYYEQAEKDSVSFRQQLERDRYIEALEPSSLSPSSTSSGASPVPPSRLLSSGEGYGRDNDDYGPGSGNVGGKAGGKITLSLRENKTPDEAGIYRKLSQLKKLIDLPDPPPFKGREAPYPGGSGFTVPDPAVSNSSPPDSSFSGTSVRQMQKMMHTMQQSGGDDTEMEQINAMLEKILDIQHPERVEEKLKEKADQTEGQIFQVSAGVREPAISFFGYSDNEGDAHDSLSGDGRRDAFYSLKGIADSGNRAISAVVYGKQVLENGSVVKLCLSDDIYIGKVLIPRGSFVYGLVSFHGNRLDITINSIRYKDFLFPVRLAVYDLDGMEGIYVPGSHAGEAARQSAGQAMQTFGLQTLNPSLSAQAATAGFQTVRNLLGRRIRVVRVTVRSGYRVLLKDQGKNTSVIPTL